MYLRNKVKISDSEWFILQVIWDKSPLYMRDIIKALNKTQWTKSTIQTMISRLVSKNILSTNKSEIAFLYSPIISKEDVVKMYTQSFIERVYSGDVQKLVSTIATEDYLTKDQKKEIKKLL